MSTHPHAFVAWKRATLPFYRNLFKIESVVIIINTSVSSSSSDTTALHEFWSSAPIIPDFSTCNKLDPTSQFYLF
jgi:hypothetical protein